MYDKKAVNPGLISEGYCIIAVFVLHVFMLVGQHRYTNLERDDLYDRDVACLIIDLYICCFNCGKNYGETDTQPDL